MATTVERKDKPLPVEKKGIPQQVLYWHLVGLINVGILIVVLTYMNFFPLVTAPAAPAQDVQLPAYDLAAWGINLIGILAGLLSGLAFAGYSLMGKSASHRGIQPWTVMLYTFAFATPFLLAYNLLPYPQPVDFASSNLLWLGGSWAGWIVLFLLAVGPTIGGFLANINFFYLFVIDAIISCLVAAIIFRVIPETKPG